METDNYKIDLYDLGGGKNIRKIWGRYYAEVHGCIFVVDAVDSARMEARRSRVPSGSALSACHQLQTIQPDLPCGCLFLPLWPP